MKFITSNSSNLYYGWEARQSIHTKLHLQSFSADKGVAEQASACSLIYDIRGWEALFKIIFRCTGKQIIFVYLCLINIQIIFRFLFVRQQGNESKHHRSEATPGSHRRDHGMYIECSTEFDSAFNVLWHCSTHEHASWQLCFWGWGAASYKRSFRVKSGRLLNFLKLQLVQRRTVPIEVYCDFYIYLHLVMTCSRSFWLVCQLRTTTVKNLLQSP